MIFCFARLFPKNSLKSFLGFATARKTKNATALAKRYGECSEPCPSFPCLIGFYQGKPPNLPRILCPCRTHKILGKDRENTETTKEIPCLKFTKEIQTTKERKDREVLVFLGKRGRKTVRIAKYHGIECRTILVRNEGSFG